MASLALVGPSCAAPGDDEVVVLAAASLTEVFRALEAPAGEAGLRPVFSFAGSHAVVEQARRGAPADVVAVADPALLPGTPALFARTRVVAVTTAGRDDLDALADLARPGVRVVLAAEAVPAGNAARQALRSEGLLDAVLENVVSNEADVKGVAAKVALGEADAGIVYVTDLRVDGRLRAVGEPLAAGARYAAAVTDDPPNPGGARDFVEFLLSPPAQSVLAEFGFETGRAVGRTAAAG